MALDGAEKPALLHREIAPQGQHRIEGRGAVPFGEDQPVPAGVLGSLGVNTHLVKIQCGQQVHHRQGAADMAGTGGVYHVQGQETGSLGGNCQVPGLLLFHWGHPPFLTSGYFSVGKYTPTRDRAQGFSPFSTGTSHGIKADFFPSLLFPCFSTPLRPGPAPRYSTIFKREISFACLL